VTDPDTWRPSATPAALHARAGMLAALRAFFAERGVLEVETSIASRAAVSDPALDSLCTRWHGPGHADGVPLYFQTSPEFAMKRLLAAGAGPIYQVCKVFRDGERGRLHHPEFSLLEWYRPQCGYRELMAEVADLVRVVLDAPWLAVEEVRYRDLFRDRLGLDPWQSDPAALRRVAVARGLSGAWDLDLTLDGWLDLLLSHCLERDLGRGRMTFVYDYPPSQAALARVSPDPEPYGERFELYLEGMELANGFHELTDPAEQRRRFTQDLAERAAAGRKTPPVDEALLAALSAGMPDASGVAMGLDRLLMVRVGADHIDQVLAFPVELA
jgi:elongation factor P--(R)-beta-lysine ligase